MSTGPAGNPETGHCLQGQTTPMGRLYLPLHLLAVLYPEVEAEATFHSEVVAEVEAIWMSEIFSGGNGLHLQDGLLNRHETDVIRSAETIEDLSGEKTIGGRQIGLRESESGPWIVRAVIQSRQELRPDLPLTRYQQ